MKHQTDIKIRAWDDTLCKYLGSPLTVEQIAKTSFASTNFSQLTFELFSGIRDKNENEIYEGDIVFVPYFHNKEFGCTEIVCLDRGGFYPFAIPSWEVTPDAYECEIRGNVHENKELLEKTFDIREV
jgi:hypothetical protein